MMNANKQTQFDQDCACTKMIKSTVVEYIEIIEDNLYRAG